MDAMEGRSSAFPIVIPDDYEEEEEPPVVPGAEDGEQAAANKRPGWLPDGDTRKTTAPSGPRFTKAEVLEYISPGGAMERVQAGIDTLNDKTTLQGKYAWLCGKQGWMLEIRAGGENFSKMYKFYAHPSTRVRFRSQEEVRRYMDEMVLPEHVDDCDTSTEKNIIAQIEFYVKSLPPGWVKETAFRKCNDGIRKDLFYTDPITGKVFRSLKAAEKYFESREPLGARVPIMSVTDMYYFDRCTDMLPCLARRLKVEGTGEGQTSCCKRTRAGKAKGKAATGTPGARKTPKPSQRP